MLVRISFEPYPEYVDREDKTGLTLHTFEEIYDVISRFGDIEEITKEDEE